METVLNPKRRSSIQEEAATWYLARQEGLDPAQSRQFSLWLAAAPEHLAEYHAVQALGRDLPRIVDTGASVSELIDLARAPDEAGNVVQLGGNGHEGANQQRQPLWAVAALIGFLAVGIGLFLGTRPTGSSGEQVFEQRLVSAHGQLLAQSLEDGSILHLDTDSAVTVRYSSTARQVVLEKGRAMFEVVHEPARPFSVDAGSARVVDIGTRFDVYLQNAATLVTVLEGRVEVSSSGTSGKQQLSAGQQIRVLGDGGLSAPTEVDAQAETAYLRRMIIFEARPLSAVVEEFNRYAGKPIVIATPQLGRRTVSGSASVDDLATFIAYLRGLPGVRVEISAERILVSQT